LSGWGSYDTSEPVESVAVTRADALALVRYYVLQ